MADKESARTCLGVRIIKDKMVRMRVDFEKFTFITPYIEIRELLVSKGDTELKRYSVSDMTLGVAKEKYKNYTLFKLLESDIDKSKTIAYVIKNK